MASTTPDSIAPANLRLPRAARVLAQSRLLEAVVLLALGAFLASMLFSAHRDRGGIATLFQSSVGRATWNSCVTCTYVTLTVIILAYCTAYYCHVYEPRRAPVILMGLMITYVMSYYVLLLSWRALMSNNGLLSHVPVLSALTDRLNYSRLGLVTVMTLRYAPVVILLLYLAIRSVPVGILYAAHNLRLSSWYAHRVCLRQIAPMIGVAVIFIFVFGSLDHLAASIVGGGRTQLVANVINDWHKTVGLQPSAMWLGLAFVFVTTAFIAAIVWALRKPREIHQLGSAPTWREARFAGQRRTFSVLTFILVLSEGGLCFALLYLSFGGAEGAFPSIQPLRGLVTDAELTEAIAVGALAAGASALVSVILALVSTIAQHVREGVRIVGAGSRLGHSQIVLACPLLLPPLLGAVAAANLQSQVFRYHGSALSIIVVHTFAFGPLAYFILAGALRRLPEQSLAAAINLRVPFARYFHRVLIRTLLLPLIISSGAVFAFSLNDSIYSRYVGGFSRSLAVVIADRQVSALASQHYAAVAMHLLVTVVMATIVLMMLRTFWSREHVL